VGSRTAGEFQGLRWILAEMSTQLEAARLMRNHAAYLEESEEDMSLDSSRTKLFCVEVANQVVGNCIQATGRYGNLRESFFHVYQRDVKAMGKAGGSLEVMKNNIARHLLGG
jgi:alkylation response protein AidB-like acyl-CoA dehydrogenase